ncbi:hypothetical protein E2562_021481 [Oryza meyeriana var. granulata]|uniref:Uncharacterized protein n=1 Tax=Oryza meyeriana var. granulata TaxID=110450 RepID=A0A6G1DZ67_9ORYZ|nr:hypothetical protein E2562_021481 [Oryza meyeriana var. granulata]
MAFAVAPPLAPPPPSPTAAWGWGTRPRATPLRFALAASTRDVDPAPPTFERLREQLLQLHAEADLTQSKANSTRVRLVRLTEAAENLKKRAAVSIRMGKENEAVDLLVQKKKLTKALESIKKRIEVLDKLSTKISEAISMKQNMLIEHALHPGMSNGEESNDNIRVISGKVGDETTSSPAKSSEKAFDLRHVVHSGMTGHLEQSELQTSDNFTFSSDQESPNSITNHSSYDDFLEHIGLQLNSLECEIEQYISSQLAGQVDIQNPINGKWQKLCDILKLVSETRERIAKIVDNTVKETGSEDLRS